MSYRRFELPEIELAPATLATTATFQTKTVANVADVAEQTGNFASRGGGAEPGQSQHSAPIEAGKIQVSQSAAPEIVDGKTQHHASFSADQPGDAPTFAGHPADWKPEPSAGVVITAPATELDAKEYDRRLGILIAALPEGSAERSRMEFARKKGWVVESEGERIYTRGRF